MSACGGSGSGREDDAGSQGIITAGGATDGVETDGETEGQASGSADGASGSAEGADDTDGIPVFDVGAPDGELACGGAGQGVGGMDFSYIWIANSPEGTISRSTRSRWSRRVAT